MANTFYVSLNEYISQLLPHGLLELPALPDLKGAWMEPPKVETDPAVRAQAALLLDQPIVLSIPGLGGTNLVVGNEGAPSIFMFTLDTVPTPLMRLVGAPLALRFSPGLLRPARHPAGNPSRVEPDPDQPYMEIRRDPVTLSLDFEGSLDLDLPGGLDLPLCLIGDTGVGVEASSVAFHGDRAAPPPGQPAGWRGLAIGSARLYLPGDLGDALGTLEVHDAFIGNGGFSGAVADTFDPPKAANLFGMPVELSRVELTFVQNSLAASSLAGRLKIPFFDEWVQVEIGLGLDGAFAVRLAGGLPPLQKPGVLEIQLASLAFALHGSALSLSLSGRLTPLLAGLDWPSLELKELVIDSDGNVHLEGGWLDLGKQFSLDFHGFQMDITRLGFGKTPGGERWLGFSGGIHLVDALPAGASVEGLRVIWSDQGPPRITLEGVAVEFESPGAFRFKGAVAYHEPAPGSYRFDGAIRLELISLGMTVDGILVVGQDRGTNYFAIYLGLDLPAGIPLGPTGLGLYGLAGLFALQMGPNKRPPEGWYENLDGGDGWYKRPAGGVTDLRTKWDPAAGALALGGGITVGTLPDNGFSVSAKMLLAIVFPGPVLVLEGRANVLRERASLTDNPIFRAVVILDGRAGSLTMGLDAHFAYIVDGELLDLYGSAEAFFKFNDLNAWHLYLGRDEPRERRLRATIFFHLFEAYAYFMLDARRLKLGAWVGYNRHWKFGPVAVDLESWIEGNAALSTKPAHFHGDIWLHGRTAVSAFGVGIGLSTDAQISADVPTPFYLKGSFDVRLELPWPLPDFHTGITLEWGDENGPRPPLPLPLKSVSVEHLKTAITWPLPRKGSSPLLLPDYDRGDGYLADPTPLFDPAAPPPPLDRLPVVPLDARLGLTFGRPINDDAQIGQPLRSDLIDQIGDPERKQGPLQVRYGLQAVELQRWRADTANWESVAARPGSPQLYGSWAPMPLQPDSGAGGTALSKLLIWSKTPFDYTRNASQAWNDQFLVQVSDYPCEPEPSTRRVCYDWRRMAVGQVLFSPWHHPDAPRLALEWRLTGDSREVLPALWVLPIGQPRPDQGVFFPGQHDTTDSLTIHLPAPANAVILTVLTAGDTLPVRAIDEAGGVQSPTIQTGPGPNFRIQTFIFQVPDGAPGLTQVELIGIQPFYLLEICIDPSRSQRDLDEWKSHNSHLQSELARWSQVDDVLAPYSTYRLKITTSVQRLSPPGPTATQTEFAFFRTEGPPGLAALSVPQGYPAGVEFASGLNDLARYVRQTVPETVAPPGQRPGLPRPIYRAYDVGVMFNQNYVELMYRLAGHDLGLYLYDNNNRPARDAAGRLIVLENPWGAREDLLLTEGGLRWTEVVNRSQCSSIDLAKIPTDSVLAHAAGQLLDPDTLYEARLVPFLLHEDFTTGLDGWQAAPLGGGPAAWNAISHPTLAGGSATPLAAGPATVTLLLDGGPDLAGIKPEFDIIRLWDDRARASKRYRLQAVDNGAKTVTVEGTPDLLNGRSRWEIPGLGAVVQAAAGESVLLRGAAGWSDYLFSADLRESSGGSIGLVFRYQDAANHYRVEMTGVGLRLLVVVGGVPQELDHALTLNFQVQGESRLTVEAVGSSLRIYLNGWLALQGQHPGLPAGQVGLYSSLSQAGSHRFTDVRVEDFRRDAPVVHRFRFTTSRFTDFYHHLHSYQDETWLLAADPRPLAGHATLPAGLPAEDETRAYGELAGQALGPEAAQDPANLQVARLEAGGEALGFLITGPEPLDPLRTGLELLRAERPGLLPVPPGTVKLAEATFGAAQPNEESITLLAREPADLSGARLEFRWLPGDGALSPDNPLLLEDDFAQDVAPAPAPPLWQPALVDLAELEIIDAPDAEDGPSYWQAQAGQLTQTAPVHTPPQVLGLYPLGQPDARQPATYAVGGSPDMRDFRLRLRVRTAGPGMAGIMLRYQDAADFLYLVLIQAPQINQSANAYLVHWLNGTPHVQWTAHLPLLNLVQGLAVELQIAGSTLRLALEGVQIFQQQVTAPAQGQIGFACQACPGVTFEQVVVTGLTYNLGAWAAYDEADAAIPSAWSMSAGVLRQTAAITGKGTYLTTGSTSWDDYRFTAQIRSDSPGMVGLIFRYQDSDNYYRLAFDRRDGSRRLVRRQNGVMTTLWQTTGDSYPLGQTFSVVVECIGTHLTGYLDDAQLFAVSDSTFSEGRVGLQCADNPTLLVYRVDVRFASPQWQTYHVFRPEERLPAGARLRLYAGNKNNAPPAEPGVRQRFVALGNEPGLLRLPAEGIDLRLTLAGQSSGHTRRFFPAAAYTPLGVRVLRKADGTGLVVLPAAGGVFASGEYRLRMIYRRDNRAVDKDSPVLSEMDDRRDEVVQLDIPWSNPH